jgi:ABC-type lipoprotein release transport system permease subunit
LLGFQPALKPPPVTILILTVGLFLAALAASALPARRASKIPPAMALRLVD